ncbi:MAG: DUF3667 domain-containing protein [Prevotellaceae bacterium]|jgi:hypothetical protein|nr:DUF3667 domain-containing protein [Prevotellaceae bacterium]
MKNPEENRLCKNCDAELQGNYCHTCGQKASTGKLTMRVLLHSLFHGIFHCDRNILYTYYALFTRPGKMIAEYIAGHRIRYFNPFTTLIITAGIVSILEEVMLAEHLHVSLPAADFILSRLWHHLNAIMSTNVAFKAIIVAPVFALSTKWVTRKKSGHHYNYTELLVACVYIACQCLAIYILLDIPAQLIFGKDSLIIEFLPIIYLSLFVWNFKQLFQLSVMKSIWRVFLIILCWLVIMAFLILLLVGLLLLFVENK